MNVNVKLVYHKNTAVRAIYPEITINTQEYNINTTSESRVNNFSLLQSGGSSIFGSNGDNKNDWSAGLNSLYTDSIRNPSPSNKMQQRLSQWSFKHYYIYVVVGANTVLDMLDTIYRNKSYKLAVVSKAYIMMDYILTFDPELYKDSKGKYPDSVFDNNHNATSEFYYTYTELFDFIDQYYDGGTHTHGLPNPHQQSQYSSYLRIREVDAWTFAKYSIDANFSDNYFTQQDMFITSMVVKEKYQMQVPWTWKHTGILTHNWQANKPYSYYDFAFSKTNFNTGTEAFRFEHCPAVLMSMTIASEEDEKLMEDITDKEYFSYACERNVLREEIRLAGGNASQFFKILNTALAVGITEFRSVDDEVNGGVFKPSMEIYSTTILSYDEDFPAYDRIRMDIYDYIDEPGAVTAANVGKWCGYAAAAIGLAFLTVVTFGGAAAVTTGAIVAVSVTCGVLAIASTTLSILSDIGTNKPWYERAFNIVANLSGFGICIDPDDRVFSNSNSLTRTDYMSEIEENLPPVTEAAVALGH